MFRSLSLSKETSLSSEIAIVASDDEESLSNGSYRYGSNVTGGTSRPSQPSLEASEGEKERINWHSLFDELQFNSAVSLLDVCENSAIAAIAVPLLRSLDDVYKTTPTIGFEFRREQEVKKTGS